MVDTGNKSIRYAAIAGIVGGAATAASGLGVQALVQPASTISDEMWSYPWSSDAFVAVSLVYAVLHLLVLGAVLGFARSGVAGSGRAARIGPVLALLGTALLLVAELASLPVKDQRMDDAGPMIVGGMFGLATLLIAVGFLIAGVSTLRARRWHGWRRYVPLGAGIWTTILVGVAMTPALAAGVGIYGLFMLALGAALYPASAGARRTTTRAKVVS